ncbi:MAG: hypothetical protein AB1757_28650 [Acidobacteriota bacterium]
MSNNLANLIFSAVFSYDFLLPKGSFFTLFVTRSRNQLAESVTSTGQVLAFIYHHRFKELQAHYFSNPQEGNIYSRKVSRRNFASRRLTLT